MENPLKWIENDLPQTFTVKLIGRKPTRGLWGIKNTRKPVDEMIAEAKSQNLSLPVVNLTVTKEGIIISHFPKRADGKVSVVDCNSNEIAEHIQKKPIFSNLRNFLAKKSSEHVETDLKSSNVNSQQTDFALLERLKIDMKFKHDCSFFGIDNISYGVQDMLFTRVFSIIVISDHGDKSRFHCYAFICEDKVVARALTYSLAAAFQIYSTSLKKCKKNSSNTPLKTVYPKILSVDLRCSDEKNSVGLPIDSEA